MIMMSSGQGEIPDRR